jgi:hypothetical protein
MSIDITTSAKNGWRRHVACDDTREERFMVVTISIETTSTIDICRKHCYFAIEFLDHNNHDWNCHRWRVLAMVGKFSSCVFFGGGGGYFAFAS